ncbi:MAG: archease [Actinobacteria bacterium]|nr:archease [Actinomycetota bacterium]
MGIRAYGKSREEVFAHAALGMMSLILDVESVSLRERKDVKARASGPEELLVKWLSEVLFLVETEGWAFGDFEVREVTEELAEGWGWGEPLDPAKHKVSGEIKAATYHMLQLKRENDTWIAQVIFDV